MNNNNLPSSGLLWLLEMKERLKTEDHWELFFRKKFNVLFRERIYFIKKQIGIITRALGWKLGFFFARVKRLLKGQDLEWGSKARKEKRNTLYENITEIFNNLWGWQGDKRELLDFRIYMLCMLILLLFEGIASRRNSQFPKNV